MAITMSTQLLRRGAGRLAAPWAVSSERTMLMYGHRGASARLAENTRAALTAALGESDGAEFDVQWLKCGTVVVLHDETLERTALPWPGVEASGGLDEQAYAKLIATNVNELTYAEVQAVRVGWPKSQPPLPSASDSGDASSLDPPYPAGGEQLMTLPDVLALLVDGFPSKQFLIEVKGGDLVAAPLVQRDMLASGVTPAQARLIGSSLPTMVELKALLPAFDSVLICDQHTEADALAAVAQAAAANLNGVDLKADCGSVTRGVVDAAHAAGLPCLVWVDRSLPGADSHEAWDTLMCRGVDLFTSDMPPRVRPWLAYFQRAEALALELAARAQSEHQLQQASLLAAAASVASAASPTAVSDLAPAYATIGGAGVLEGELEAAPVALAAS